MEHPIKMDNLGVPLFLETPGCKFHQKDAMLTARGALVLASVLALDHPLSLMGLCLLSLGCRESNNLKAITKKLTLLARIF